MYSHVENFRTAMCNAGLDYDGPIVDDGNLHRFRAVGDHRKDPWYLLHDGPPPAVEKNRQEIERREQEAPNR